MLYLRRTVVVAFVIFILGLFLSMAALSLGINLLAFAMIGLWITYYSKNKTLRGFWPRLGPDYLLWAYWAVVAVGAIFITFIPADQRFYTAMQGKWIIFLYALTAAIVTFDLDEKNVVKMLAWLALPIAIYGVFQSLTGIDWIRGDILPSYEVNTYRARGFTHNSMTFGHSLALLISALSPFFLFRVFKESSRTEKLLGVAIALSCVALLFTYTRGAWVALIAQGVVVLLLWNKKHALKVFLAAALVGGAAFALSSKMRSRFISIGDSQSGSTIERRMLWESNWHMFLDHPLLGIGAGRNLKEVEAYNMRLHGRPGPLANAHNNILHLLAGTGIFGFIFWAGFMLWFLWNAFKNYKQALTPSAKALHLSFIGVWIAFHVGGLTQTTFDDTEIRLFFCLWLALSIASYAKQNGPRSVGSSG